MAALNRQLSTSQVGNLNKIYLVGLTSSSIDTHITTRDIREIYNYIHSTYKKMFTSIPKETQ